MERQEVFTVYFEFPDRKSLAHAMEVIWWDRPDVVVGGDYNANPLIAEVFVTCQAPHLIYRLAGNLRGIWLRPQLVAKSAA